MALSDSEFLRAVQSGGDDSEQARQELFDRFGKLLYFQAARACQLNRLHGSEADDVVGNALVTILDPTAARFDPDRATGNKVEAYLSGLIQNAARKHARSIRQGADRRHDYSSELNSVRGLPSTVEAIPDTYDDNVRAARQDLVATVLNMAGSGERELINRVFFAGEELESVAAGLGVNRSTVSRRLTRFYDRVRALNYQLLGDDPPCPN